MKVFITIPWFLPAFRAGGPIQSIANMVDQFSENIQYYIFCGHTDLNGEKLAGIQPGRWITYNANTQVWYAENKSDRKQLLGQIKNIAPDTIFITGIFSWKYNIVPLLFAKANKKILSVRGMLHPGALSQKKRKKYFFLQTLQWLNIQRSVIFHATSPQEADYIHQQFGKNAVVRVADNFARKMVVYPPKLKMAGTLELVTIALISPMKNHLLVLEALQKCRSNIHYNIYGPVKDIAYWQQCLQAITGLPANIAVTYHGEILPDKIDTVLAQSDVFIMPSKSENFGHAIAEAFSAGKPVITSHTTPWNNLRHYNAGINVDFSITDLTSAIELFAAMAQPEYSNFTKGSLAYIAANSNINDIKTAYQNLFFQN